MQTLETQPFALQSFETQWLGNLQRGVLQLPRCTHCGVWNWYPLDACRACQCMEFVWQDVAPVGTLFSWTRVHRAFTKKETNLPYVVGLIALQDAPAVRLTCRLLGAVEERPSIGAEVCIKPILSGAQPHWGYEPKR